MPLLAMCYSFFKVEGVSLTFLDAGHCPGSAMVAFEAASSECTQMFTTKRAVWVRPPVSKESSCTQAPAQQKHMDYVLTFFRPCSFKCRRVLMSQIG